MTAASSDDLTKTFGVLLIGFIFCVVLYGLTFFRTPLLCELRIFLTSASETYIYFTRFPSDHFGTKWTVSASLASPSVSLTPLWLGWSAMVCMRPSQFGQRTHRLEQGSRHSSHNTG